MKPIRTILLIFESPNGRYHGFRYIRCRDGAVAEGQGPGESNLLFALHHDESKGWRRDYFYTIQTIPEKQIFMLPHVGFSKENILASVRRQWRAWRKQWKKDHPT